MSRNLQFSVVTTGFCWGVSNTLSGFNANRVVVASDVDVVDSDVVDNVEVVDGIVVDDVKVVVAVVDVVVVLVVGLIILVDVVLAGTAFIGICRVVVVGVTVVTGGVVCLMDVGVDGSVISDFVTGVRSLNSLDLVLQNEQSKKMLVARILMNDI